MVRAVRLLLGVTVVAELLFTSEHAGRDRDVEPEWTFVRLGSCSPGTLKVYNSVVQ